MKDKAGPQAPLFKLGESEWTSIIDSPKAQ